MIPVSDYHLINLSLFKVFQVQVNWSKSKLVTSFCTYRWPLVLNPWSLEIVFIHSIPCMRSGNHFPLVSLAMYMKRTLIHLQGIAILKTRFLRDIWRICLLRGIVRWPMHNKAHLIDSIFFMSSGPGFLQICKNASSSLPEKTTNFVFCSLDFIYFGMSWGLKSYFIFGKRQVGTKDIQ